MSELQNSPSKDATSVFAQPALLRKRSAHNSDICRAKKQSIPPLSSSKLDFDTLPEENHTKAVSATTTSTHPEMEDSDETSKSSESSDEDSDEELGGRWNIECREHVAFLKSVKKPTMKFIKKKDLKISKVVVGTDSQGEVREGEYIWNCVAVKSIARTNDKNALKELVFLNDLKHPKIIICFGVCIATTQLHNVMEYFDSKSLHDITFVPTIREEFDLTDEEKLFIIEQAATGLTYIHSQSILHRDIKPGNILVNKTCLHVKICDLGLASSKFIEKDLKSTRDDRMRGTYFFMSPEIFLAEKKNYSTKSDVWAFACSIYEIFSLDCVWPVLRGDAHHSTEVALSNKATPPYHECVPAVLHAVMKGSFDHKPDLRPEMFESVRALRSRE
ncbi:hypothetical protein QAD02_012630 [Eretmocerus hayati]|uniref:Uncharacterized protein n=1 Tax=Eretmocerus hayati TaxID=131215 RepID=A0ACC2P150_9HYME|nr:hypothetical protein QAD02_012630 [Eretmocerus hayati]